MGKTVTIEQVQMKYVLGLEKSTPYYVALKEKRDEVRVEAGRGG